jgi:hypothetical protein
MRAVALTGGVASPLEVFTRRDATWRSPLVVANRAGERAAAISANGRALIVWQAGPRIRAAALDPRGRMERPREIGLAPALRGGPYASVNEAGDAVAAWGRRSPDGRGRQLLVAVRRGSGAWSKPVVLSGRPKALGGVAVAVDPQGAGYILWAQGGEQSEPSVRPVLAAVRPAGARRWKITELDRGYGASVALGVDETGRVSAVWGRALDRPLFSAVHSAGAGWRKTGSIPGSLCCLDSLTVSPLGDTFLLANAGRTRVWRRAAGSTRWEIGAADVIHRGAGGLDRLMLAVNAAGDAVLGWDSFEGHTSQPVFAAAYEAPSRPAIRSLRLLPRQGNLVRLALRLSAPGRVLVRVRRAGGKRPLAGALVNVRRRADRIVLPSRLQRAVARPGRYVVAVDAGARDPRESARSATFRTR